MQTIVLNEEILSAMDKMIRAAKTYEKLTGRYSGITSEVGEILVCEKLKLEILSDKIAAGFDAVDKAKKTYQIKTRRAKNGRGRIGSFSKHKFDFALLAELNSDYKLDGIWKVSYAKINPIIEANKRRNPSLSKFKSVAKKIC